MSQKVLVIFQKLFKLYTPKFPLQGAEGGIVRYDSFIFMFR